MMSIQNIANEPPNIRTLNSILYAPRTIQKRIAQQTIRYMDNIIKEAEKLQINICI